MPRTNGYQEIKQDKKEHTFSRDDDDHKLDYGREPVQKKKVTLWGLYDTTLLMGSKGTSIQHIPRNYGQRL